VYGNHGDDPKARLTEVYRWMPSLFFPVKRTHRSGFPSVLGEVINSELFFDGPDLVSILSSYLLTMSERENLSTGIYASLSVFVVLICLIGAFVLPPSLNNGKWLGIAALVGFLVVLPVLLRLAHRVVF